MNGRETFRRCPRHGWVPATEYSPDEVGELRCDECGQPVTGRRTK